MKLLVIDSGTTNSRVRLTVDGHVLASVSRPVGSRDVAISGSTDALKQALKACIEELMQSNGLTGGDITAIIASGMITSNMGLLEVPHLSAPADLDLIAANLRTQTFPEISDKPIHFIPGVKTGFDGALLDRDMMRGEEAEIFGFPDTYGSGAEEAVLFMHYGSHHKAILWEGGAIRSCRTSVTGELLMAVSQSTVLKSSLMPVGDADPDPDWVRQGWEGAEEAGFGRALFTTRVLDTMERRSKRETTSWMIGALLTLDWKLIEAMVKPSVKRIVLYGKELFPRQFAPLLDERMPEVQIDVISEQQSDTLSALGAVRIYSRYQEIAKSENRRLTI